ncbi:MAG: hypothetical protein ACE5GX_00145 [Thermoanaerobaculia bacterium]
MKRNSGWRTGGAAVLGLALAAGAAQAQTTRWWDWALSPQLGSAELSLEKRLYEPAKDEVACMRCKHYAELRVGIDEQDFQGADFDVTHFIAGYRYYAYVQLKDGPRGHKVDGGWAAYLGAGLGRYELDPGEPVSGWNARFGVDKKVTETCKGGKPRKWALDWEVSATYHNLSVPGADFDYWNFQTGPRFLFPSSRDTERAEYLKICELEGEQ